MQTDQSHPRPKSVARALEHIRRDVESDPEATPATAVVERENVSSRYFDPGDYAAERDWWAKQLGRR